MRTFVSMLAFGVFGSCVGAAPLAPSGQSNFASAATPIVRMGERSAPSTPRASDVRVEPKSGWPTFEIPPFPYPDEQELSQRKLTSTDILSFGRAPAKFGIKGTIFVAADVDTIKVRLSSFSARHLRTAWRFAGIETYAVTVIDSAGRELTNQTASVMDADPRVVWSAISDGDSQDVLISRLSGVPQPWTATLELVAHFDEILNKQTFDVSPKSFGDSAYCQRDIACLIEAISPAEQDLVLGASRGVAFMVTTRANGDSYVCTGTLLNSANYPRPLFLSANHCMEGAVTLDTYWFYSRAYCGYGPVSQAVQGTGGARTIWASTAQDSVLLELAQTPPSGVSYAGWDGSNPVASSTTVLAIHHPRGDVKKASFGTVLGVNSVPTIISGHTYPAFSMYSVDWDLGIVEPGSSGSAFFTPNASGTESYVRGTLTGGNTTCSGIASRTYYQRFDYIYPYISGPLTVRQSPATVNVVEYHHGSFDHYFITSVAAEIALLDARAPPFQDWSRTGYSFNSYVNATAPASSVAICRFFNESFAPKSSHFYAPHGLGCEATIAGFPDWKLEDDKLFNAVLPDSKGVCPSGTVPVYRMYNQGMGNAPNHRFVTSAAERQRMINQGWVAEGNGIGVGTCALP